MRRQPDSTTNSRPALTMSRRVWWRNRRRPKNIKVSSIFVPTNGLDASIISIMQTYARLSSGFYTQTASNGVGTGAGIQQIVARCGGNLVFLQPTDGQKLLALPAVIRGRATPNDGENFSRVTLAIQRGQDDFYWTGSSWASRFKALPTRLESTNWSASDGSYALPSGKDLLEDTYRLIAFAYDGSGKQSKSAAITIEIGTDSEVSLLDANDLQSRAERTKAVADGVTQILVKFTTDQSGLVSFEKRDDLKTDRGSLTQQDGAGSAENLQTIREGSNFVAFALYTVPKQLPGAEAKVKFVVKFAADAGGSATRSRELGLVRPPVVLVHGLWSNPDGAFPDNGAGVRSFLKGAGFKIGVADYSGSNADHFTDNVGKVREAIRSVKQDYRDKKIAITQVDVVAHSMGGLLTRLFVQGEFRGSSTFGKGSVRRLITLGTPHYGSSLANLLVLLRGKSSFGIGLTGIASFIKHPINRGAIDDLQLGSGALIAIDTTPVRSFAVVGNVPNNAGAVLGDVTKVLYLYLRITGSPLDRVDLSSEGAFLSSLFNRENSDLIVGTSSQKGGLSSRYNDVFAPVAHFDLSRFGVPGETVDNFVALSVVKLLSGPEDDLAPAFPDVTARSFSAFSAPPPVPAPIPGRASATAPEVKLITLSPAEATVFAPGQSVVFRATPLAGANVKQVLFITGYDDALESNLIEAAPFQATFVIPADFSGDYRVVALARDAAGNLEQIQRTYKVLPAAPPQSLRIEPTSMRLTSQNATRALAVFGTFAGGVSIDLSSAVTGTKYSTSDSSIATVSAEGVVTAKNSGNAIVTATNGGQSADALVTVQFNAPVVTGLTPPNAAPGARNLTLQISGSDFGGAASVEFLLNGEPDPNISVSNLRVGDSNSEIKVTVNVSSAAATGERSVVVTTPGGRSAEEIGEGNLFTVGSLSADLGVTLTASPTPALVGAGLTYTVVVSNSGPATATGVRASIVLPANTQFVGATSAQSTCALSGNTLVCEVGSLAAGQSVSIQIVVRPTRDATLSATATVSGDTTDPNPANNSATRALTAITPLTDVTSKVRVNLGTLYRVTDYSGGVFNRKRERRFRQNRHHP